MIFVPWGAGGFGQSENVEWIYNHLQFIPFGFGSEVVFELELTDGFSALDLNAGVGLECVIGFVVGFF